MGISGGLMCFCGNTADAYTSRSQVTGCEPCVGDTTQTCGGTAQTSVYTTGTKYLRSNIFHK